MKRRCVTWDEVERLRTAKHDLLLERSRAQQATVEARERLQRLEEESSRLNNSYSRAKEEAQTACDAYLSQELRTNCKRLRKNDPNYTSFEPSPRGPYPQGYGKRLGRALEGNTHASSLELSLHDLVATEDRNEDLDLLLRHIQTSPAMRVIKLDDNGMGGQMENVGLLLNAMAKNPNIERFDGECDIPAEPLCRFLSKATKIKSIVLHSQVWHEVTEEERNKVANAVRGARSIASLALVYDDMTPLILSKIGDCDSALRELKLRFFDELEFEPNSASFWSAASKFLGTSRMLEHLELRQFQFVGQTTDHFIAALKQFRPADAASTKRTLTLDNCYMDTDAIEALIRFMHDTPSADDSRSDQPLLQLNIRTQHTECWRHQGRALILLMKRPTLVEGCVDYMRCNLGSVACSALHSLTLDPKYVNIFFDQLAWDVDQVFLQALNITSCTWDQTMCLYVAASMPSWMSIRDLSIPSIPTDMDPAPRQMVRDGFRQNSSLYSVTIRDTDGLSKSELKRIDAFCQRNKFLDRHWRNDTRQLISSNASMPSRASETIADANRPCLIHVANQVPKAVASRLISYVFKVKGSDDEVDQSVGEQCPP